MQMHLFQRTRCLQQCDAVDMTVSNEALMCPFLVRGAVVCLMHQEMSLCVPPCRAVSVIRAVR